MTVAGIARRFGVPPAEVLEDLRHIDRTLRHEHARLRIEPAVCRKCGFVFRADRPSKPGKCPRCRGTWISEPEVSIG